MVSSSREAASEGRVTGSKGPGGATLSLKKGPWTAAEDAILMEYVKKHGEGNWNAVQNYSGLMRCGKSCRLRWANHLRPNLKKGSFSPEEERIIIELHSKLGNKWARMAAQLPGRTDNEIKNYWNTRMKRRQRAGLPIYPQEVQEKAAAFHPQQQDHHKRSHNNSSASQSSLFASQNQAYNPSLSLFETIPFLSGANPLQNQPSSNFYSNLNQQFKLFCNNNVSTGFSLPTTPYAPSSTSLYNQTIPSQTLPVPPFKYIGNSERDMSFSSMTMGASVDPIHQFVYGLETQLPSSQIPIQPKTTASLGSSGDFGAMITSIDNNNDYKISPKATRSNSGLLDALLQEAQKLSRDEKIKDEILLVAAHKGTGAAGVRSEGEEGNECVELGIRNSGEANADNQLDDLSSSQSSIGVRTSEKPLEVMNSMDDELMTLLNNFPLSMPLPEWYPGSSHTFNGSSSSLTGGNVDTNQQNGSADPAATSGSPDLQWSLDSCCWNNMPGIC